MSTSVKDLMENQEFIEKMMNAESADEVSALFAEHDIILSADEVNNLKTRLESMGSGELSEDELSDVAGGADPDYDDIFKGIIIGLEGLFDRLNRKRW